MWPEIKSELHGKIYVTISDKSETLLCDTGCWGIFICLKPSTIVNIVLQYVIMIWFDTEQYT